jgi:NADH:ubiquinone oxidoreductase subunit 3 (subunit A)
MSFAAAAVLVFLAVAVAVPGITLGVSMLVAGRPRWISRRRREPTINTFLMLVALAIVTVAFAFVVPWAVAFGGLPHHFTAVEGLFLAALTLFGAGYAWRRAALTRGG